jgi:hypothetical protein
VTPVAERLKALADQGLTAREAAEATGSNDNNVRMVAKRNGFRFAPVAGLIVKRLRDAAAAGMTPAEAARHLGIGRTSVHRLARQHGIRMETRLTRLAAERKRAARAKSRRCRAKPTPAEAAKQEAELMARWRAAWAERKAARDRQPEPEPEPIVVRDEASLGAAMRAVAARESAAFRRRIMGVVAA